MKKDILEFTLHTVEHRNNCVQVIDKYQHYAQANTPLVVTIKPKKITRNQRQNAILHAVLTDISEQVKHYNQYFDVVTWKRLCMAAWLREKHEQPRLIPSLDGHGVDVIFERTSKLSVKECAEFCTWCIAYGDEHNVKFKQKAI